MKRKPKDGTSDENRFNFILGVTWQAFETELIRLAQFYDIDKNKFT